MTPTLEQLNRASAAEFAESLCGTYEHSPWVIERAFAARPFASLAALKRALVEVVRTAGDDAQLALIRAHPQLAGRAMQTNALTRESTNEQGRATARHTPNLELTVYRVVQEALNNIVKHAGVDRAEVVVIENAEAMCARKPTMTMTQP